MISVSQRCIGLARRLSKLGYCSRSQGIHLVRGGRVAVNRTVHRDPEYPVRERDRISVDGRDVDVAGKTYLKMNKPRGLVTTASDEKARRTVYSLLDPGLPWIAPVGRLDQASEGMLLFTNDSEWAAKITSPALHIEKTYHVQIATLADPELTARLTKGITVGGEGLRAIRASVLRSGTKNSWIEVVLDEGRNRHIRRMLTACGIEVLRLVRVAIGPLVLGNLAKGSVRALTHREKQEIDGLVVVADSRRNRAKLGL